MRQFMAWFERHKVLGNLLGGIALIGGMWIFAAWMVNPAKPDTPTAHIYCAVIASNPDGTLNQERSGAEFALSRKLAFERGGAAGVENTKTEGEKILAEFLMHTQKGDLDDLRRHYQDKCLGY